MTVSTQTSVLSDAVRGFLGNTVRHATIATVNRDGRPHQIVVWYLLRGDEIVVNSRRGRRWPSNVGRERHATLSVYEGEEAVTLECELVRSYEGDQAQADIAEMARRYYSPELAERQIARFRTEDRISFVLRPDRMHIHGDPR